MVKTLPVRFLLPLLLEYIPGRLEESCNCDLRVSNKLSKQWKSSWFHRCTLHAVYNEKRNSARMFQNLPRSLTHHAEMTPWSRRRSSSVQSQSNSTARKRSITLDACLARTHVGKTILRFSFCTTFILFPAIVRFPHVSIPFPYCRITFTAVTHEFGITHMCCPTINSLSAIPRMSQLFMRMCATVVPKRCARALSASLGSTCISAQTVSQSNRCSEIFAESTERADRPQTAHK